MPRKKKSEQPDRKTPAMGSSENIHVRRNLALNEIMQIVSANYASEKKLELIDKIIASVRGDENGSRSKE